MFSRQPNHPAIRNLSPTRRSRSPVVTDRPPEISEVTTPEEVPETSNNRVEHDVEIIDVSESVDVPGSDENVNGGPEPVITEQEEIEETPPVVERTEMFTEIQTVPTFKS